MPKAKAAPNFNPMLEETGDALTDEEKVAAAAEEAGTAVTPAPEGEEEQPEGQVAEPAETADGKGKGKPPKVIPYDRFQEVVGERNQTKQQLEQVNRELAEQRERWGRLDERQRLATEAQQRATQAAAAAERAKLRPDPDVDPSGARAWDDAQTVADLRQQVGQLQQFVTGRSQELQGWAQQQELGNWVTAQANLGRQKYAYYDQAIDFARDTRKKMWMSVGHNEQSAASIVANEEAALVQSARQAGISLADAVMNMTTQWGFKPPTNGAAKPNGVNGNAKLDQIAAGQRVQGLGRTQSAESPAQLPWQQMDDQAFAQFIVGLEDNDYLEMTKSKEFNKRVLSLDTR